jgi:hypothetical protein
MPARKNAMTPSHDSRPYEAPALRVLGSVHELTQQGCDKRLNGSDGFTFMGQPIVCRSP